MQTSYLVILDGAIILFLYFKNPFSTLRGKLAQYYYEVITLLVHLCAFILSLQDSFNASSYTARLILSTGILYLNTALVSGAIGFMFIEIYNTISEKTRAARYKLSEDIAIQTTDRNNFDSQNLTLATSPSQHLQTRAQRKNETWVHNQQTSSLENLHLLPRSKNNSNIIISDFSLESSQAQEFPQNPENSFGEDLHARNKIDQNRGLRPTPIFYRPLPRRFRQSNQKKRSGRPNNAIHPARFVNEWKIVQCVKTSLKIDKRFSSRKRIRALFKKFSYCTVYIFSSMSLFIWVILVNENLITYCIASRFCRFSPLKIFGPCS